MVQVHKEKVPKPVGVLENVKELNQLPIRKTTGREEARVGGEEWEEEFAPDFPPQKAKRKDKIEFMPRPKKPRCLRFAPGVHYFKPQGVPLRQLEEVLLLPDELEALKLHEGDRLSQTEGAQKMQVSQPTFARILSSAYQKVVSALINGRAIRLE